MENISKIANIMLKPFGTIIEEKKLPTEYFLLNEAAKELQTRSKCFGEIVNKLQKENALNCEEIAIVDYGCGQGFASLCLLEAMEAKGISLSNIKNVKLIDKNSEALKRALLHFSVFYPNIEVVGYEHDFLDKAFSIKCDSLLTINIFSHTSMGDLKFADTVKDIILLGQNLFMHNIIVEELLSLEMQNFIDYCLNSIEDYVGCSPIADFKITDFLNNDKLKSFRCSILSRTKIEDIVIPRTAINSYSNLCPGEPITALINVPRRVMWYDRPLENTTYVENLDDENKISFDYDFISPSFEDKWKKTADSLNPHTIKECAEHFYEGHISHAISCGLKCGKDIVALYERAAKDGITEAYNNLGVLQFFMQPDETIDETSLTELGITYFKLAADNGSSSAMMNIASYYMEQHRELEAIEYYMKAADANEPNALFNLALIYNFGLLCQNVNLEKAEELYTLCIDKIQKEDCIDKKLLDSCCLNLILLLCKKKAHYLQMLRIYSLVESPSYRLRYCIEMLGIIHTNRFHKNIKELLIFGEKEDKPFMKYNYAIFQYEGLTLNSQCVVKKNKDAALEKMKELAENSVDWEERGHFVYGTYASWLHKNNTNHGEFERYWRKASQINSKSACAYFTNIAIAANISDVEKEQIWRKYAFGDGCESCHECSNYNTILRCCPKAQFNWAKDYEKDKEFAESLIRRSAEQNFGAALYYMSYNRAIVNNFSAPEIEYLSKKNIFDQIRDTSINMDTKISLHLKLINLLSKDQYYDFLLGSAIQNISKSRSLIVDASKLRNNIYEYIYWVCVNFSNENDKTKIEVLNFLSTKCNRTLDVYFNPLSICERQMLAVAEKIANKTKDIAFICVLANFYSQNESLFNLYKAKEYYLLAKEKGGEDIDVILQNIEQRIIDEESKWEDDYSDNYDSSYDYDYKRERWDALTDGMYGDYPGGDIDYDVFGF